MGDYSSAWGKALLQKLGAPVTKANLAVLSAWAQAEGSNARNNPFDTTQQAAGATAFNSVGVRNYLSPQQGLDATYQTLTNGRYPDIIAALKKGNDPAGVADAIGASPWGSSGRLIRQILGLPASKQTGGPQPASGGGKSTAVNAGAATGTAQDTSALSTLTGGIGDIGDDIGKGILEALSPLVSLLWNMALVGAGAAAMVVGIVLLARLTTAGRAVEDDAAKAGALAIPGVGEAVAGGAEAQAGAGFLKGGLARWTSSSGQGQAVAKAGAAQRSRAERDAREDRREQAARGRERRARAERTRVRKEKSAAAQSRANRASLNRSRKTLEGSGVQFDAGSGSEPTRPARRTSGASLPAVPPF